MTKKHFKEIAKILKNLYSATKKKDCNFSIEVQAVIDDFIDYFSIVNQRFDAYKFKKAIFE